MTKIQSAGGSVVRDVPLITLLDLAKEPGGDDPDNMYGTRGVHWHKMVC